MTWYRYDKTARPEGAVVGDVLLLQRQVDPRDAEVHEPRMPELLGGIVGLCECGRVLKA